MLVDAHVHVFPPDIEAERERICKKEPYFETLFSDPRSPLGRAEELIREMDSAGMDAAVVCAFPWRDPGLVRHHAEYLVDCCRRWPGRLVPLASADPLSPGALPELERALAAGSEGLGEIGAYHDDVGSPEVLSGLERMAALCREAGRPMLLHTNEPVGHRYPGKSPMTLGGLQAFLERARGTKIQLAHMGGGLVFFWWMRRAVKRLVRNCIFDVSAMPFLYRPEAVAGLLKTGAPLCLGTDWPLLGLERYRRELDGTEALEDAEFAGLRAARFWSIRGEERDAQ